MDASRCQPEKAGLIAASEVFYYETGKRVFETHGTL